MDASIMIGILGLIVAILGAATGYWLGRRSEFAVAEWMRELRSWASEVIKILSEVSFVTRANKSEHIDQVPYAQELSALIEIGRFYLPNQRQNEYGLDKPLAYRGYRHDVLDPLVAAFRVIEGDVKLTLPKADILWELRREFVSRLFQILGPEHHNKVIGNIIRTSHRSRKDDSTVGGLLAGNNLPQGADSVLQMAISKVENRSPD